MKYISSFFMILCTTASLADTSTLCAKANKSLKAKDDALLEIIAEQERQKRDIAKFKQDKNNFKSQEKSMDPSERQEKLSELKGRAAIIQSKVAALQVIVDCVKRQNPSK